MIARILSYAAITAFFAFVVMFQVRASMETVHLERNLDFHIPFLIMPFTNRVDATTPGVRMHVEDGGPLWGEEIVAVNGRPFTGMSGYLRELREFQVGGSAREFFVNVRSGDGRIRQVKVVSPHCTCGTAEVWQILAAFVVPPVLCILLGFTTVYFAQRSPVAWSYLALMLSVSQLQFWPEPYTGFQFTAVPMSWGDWLRVPSVGYRSCFQHLWPAALMILSTHVFRIRGIARRLTVALASVALTFATLEAACAVSWSEDFQKLTGLYQWLRYYDTERIVASLACATIIAWIVNRTYGLAVASLASVAIVALYWSAPRTSGGTRQFAESLHFWPPEPEFYRTPEAILACFVVSCLLAGYVINRRRVNFFYAVGMVCCLPLAAHAVLSWSAYWYPFFVPGWENWPWFMIGSAGLGGVVITRQIIRELAMETIDARAQ